VPVAACPLDGLVVVPAGAGAGVVTVVVLVVVLAGVVTVVVGAVTVVVGVLTVVFCVIVGETVVVVLWPMLSDWLLTVGVCLELLSDTSRITTTITAITRAVPAAIAQPLGPARPEEGG
jgi:hypothetical protein